MLEEKADVFVSGLLDEVLRMPGWNVFLVLRRVLGMPTFGQKVNSKSNKPGSECDLNCRVRRASSVDRRCTKGSCFRSFTCDDVAFDRSPRRWLTSSTSAGTMLRTPR